MKVYKAVTGIQTTKEEPLYTTIVQSSGVLANVAEKVKVGKEFLMQELSDIAI